MPRNNWGTPAAKDGTAWLEQIVKEEAEAFNKAIQEEGLAVLNRPIGSLPISSGDQELDFEAIRYDVAKLAQLHAQRVQLKGERQATAEFVEYFERMTRKGD